LPDGERWLFEPKWDGFRALVFRDADELFIQSRDGVLERSRRSRSDRPLRVIARSFPDPLSHQQKVTIMLQSEVRQSARERLTEAAIAGRLFIAERCCRRRC
jgi:hypothetical protein